jgi:hypothetical protein
MSTTYFLTSATKWKASASEFSYPTIEAALGAADVILGNGADSVWILDQEGKLILPADQVRLRAPSSGSAPGAR